MAQKGAHFCIHEMVLLKGKYYVLLGYFFIDS